MSNHSQDQGTRNDLNDRLHVAIRAARAGREVLLSYLGKLKNVESKFQAGLVSEADKEAELAIFRYLREYFPNDEYMGEESNAAGAEDFGWKPATSKGRWIVDPLDGTTNYVHQFPVFAVSIGWEHQGKSQIGVIDVPMMNEVYTAIRGQGAWVNGRKLNVSGTSKLADSFLATGFFTEDQKIFDEQLKHFSKLAPKVRAVRRAGAAAYDLACVARGVFDGYWETGLKPWDASAGMLLVEEAGGMVTTYDGEPYDPYCKNILATNGKLNSALVRELSLKS